MTRTATAIAPALADARAAHEIRGALHIVGLVVALARRSQALTSEHLDAIEHQLARAARALDTHGIADASEIDVTEAVTAAVAGWVGRAVTVTPDPGTDRARLRADPGRLAQALDNVLANALEHGGEPVVVRVRATETTVRIEVTDTGAGLPRRLDQLIRSRHRRATGPRGHGLPIAAAAVEADGGRLYAAPSPAGARLVLEYQRAALGCRSGTTGAQPAASTPTRLGGVSTSTASEAARPTGSASP